MADLPFTRRQYSRCLVSECMQRSCSHHWHVCQLDQNTSFHIFHTIAFDRKSVALQSSFARSSSRASSSSIGLLWYSGARAGVGSLTPLSGELLSLLSGLLGIVRTNHRAKGLGMTDLTQRRCLMGKGNSNSKVQKQIAFFECLLAAAR